MINLLWNTSKKWLLEGPFLLKLSLNHVPLSEDTDQEFCQPSSNSHIPSERGMACAAPQVMSTGACACRACSTGEKCLRDRQSVKSLSGEVAEFIFCYTEVHWCAEVEDWQLQLSITHIQHQHLILFSLLFLDCWKGKFCVHAGNHICSSLRQEWEEMLPYKWAVALHKGEKQQLPWFGREKV